MSRSSPSLDADTAAAEIEQRRIVAVLRGRGSTHLTAVAAALIDAGVTAIEVTMTTPDALDCIETLALTHGEDAIVGAGSVSSPDAVRSVADAGGRFIASPCTQPDVVEAAVASGLAAYPGAMTPTEIVAATDLGAAAVKLFPAAAFTPRYLEYVRGPLPDIRVMVTGGIPVAAVGDWLHAGASVVGLGSSLIGRTIETGPDADLLARARASVQAAGIGS